MDGVFHEGRYSKWCREQVSFYYNCLKEFSWPRNNVDRNQDLDSESVCRVVTQIFATAAHKYVSLLFTLTLLLLGKPQLQSRGFSVYSAMVLLWIHTRIQSSFYERVSKIIFYFNMYYGSYLFTLGYVSDRSVLRRCWQSTNPEGLPGGVHVPLFPRKNWSFSLVPQK